MNEPRKRTTPRRRTVLLGALSGALAPLITRILRGAPGTPRAAGERGRSARESERGAEKPTWIGH